MKPTEVRSEKGSPVFRSDAEANSGPETVDDDNEVGVDENNGEKEPGEDDIMSAIATMSLEGRRLVFDTLALEFYPGAGTSTADPGTVDLEGLRAVVRFLGRYIKEEERKLRASDGSPPGTAAFK